MSETHQTASFPYRIMDWGVASGTRTYATAQGLVKEEFVTFWGGFSSRHYHPHCRNFFRVLHGSILLWVEPFHPMLLKAGDETFAAPGLVHQVAVLERGCMVERYVPVRDYPEDADPFEIVRLDRRPPSEW